MALNPEGYSYSLVGDCMMLFHVILPLSHRDNPAERLGYLRGGLKDIKTHR